LSVACVCGVQRPIRPATDTAGGRHTDYYLQFDLRHNTQKAYKSHNNTFAAICRHLHIDGSRRLSEDDLCEVVSRYASTHKATTVGGFVSALAYNTATAGLGDLPRGVKFERVLRGISNCHADQTTTPKIAVTMADMVAFHHNIAHSTFEGARDWCACTFAFFGLLRINEYANGHMHHGHVQRTAVGVMLSIPVSKTSLTPVRIDIAARSDMLCPSRALSAYLSFFDRYPDLPRGPSTALFIARHTPSDWHPMTDNEFITAVRRLLSLASPGCSGPRVRMLVGEFG
jgi:hypothetical protein